MRLKSNDKARAASMDYETYNKTTKELCKAVSIEYDSVVSITLDPTGMTVVSVVEHGDTITYGTFVSDEGVVLERVRYETEVVEKNLNERLQFFG